MIVNHSNIDLGDYHTYAFDPTETYHGGTDC